MSHDPIREDSKLNMNDGYSDGNASDDVIVEVIFVALLLFLDSSTWFHREI